MTFADLENSNYEGEPILLYLFIQGGVKQFAYTTADRDLVIFGITWLSVPISDGGYNLTGDTSADTFQVTLPIDTEVAQLFQGLPPSETVQLQVIRKHMDSDDYAVAWTGLVSARSQTDELTAVLTCQSLANTFSGGGLRCAWGRGCQHFLYDSECRVNPAAFLQPVDVVTLNGSDIQVTGMETFAQGYFSGGSVQWSTDGDIFTTRMIIDHDGDLLRLLGGTYGITAGMTLVAYPGCDRTAQTCNDKFANIDNFGGIIHLPGKSPFDGEIVF